MVIARAWNERRSSEGCKANASLLHRNDSAQVPRAAGELKGALLTSIFATTAINPAGAEGDICLDGGNLSPTLR